MDLMTLLPNYYDKNDTMIKLQEILSAETENLDIGLSQTISECFVSTASAMLSRYEKLYGLEVDVSKSNSFRRERIKAKIAGAGTTTKQMVIDTARSYSNGEVEVIEDNENSRFTIKFVGTLGIPGNMADLKLTIEEIKPAHLAVTYEYVYNTWGNISALTWEQTGAYTWEQIRTVNI
ncbi:putative phage tail protein [Lacrimispora sp.]|uniref:putative phage tail protein n=1 Tax=Lacrimispora sp. TaxID=2719234 RepID=UPI00346047B8